MRIPFSEPDPSRGQPAAQGAVSALCRAAAADLSGSVVTVLSADGAQAVLAGSDEVSLTRHELEFSTGEGPACDAFTIGRPVLVPALQTKAGRWPAYVTAATAAGVGAVFAFPLQLGALRIGVLTCYSDRPRNLTATEISALLGRAEAVIDVLLDTTDRDPSVTGQELAGAVHLRNEVFQAQGMVTEQLGVGLGEALSRIRGHAFAEDLDLDALATDIVAGRVRLTDDRLTPPEDPLPRAPETEAP